MALIPTTPIVNAGLLYVNGLQVANSVATPLTQLNIAAGQARDSTDTNDIVLPQIYNLTTIPPTPTFVGALPLGATINGLFVGPNGVDQAVLAANTLYAVYIIASSISTFTSNSQLGGGPLNLIQPTPASNPHPTAGLLSLASNAAPYLPRGYDMYRRIGYVSTNGSSDFLVFHQFLANSQTRYYWYDVPQGIAATTGSTTYVKAPLTASGSPNQLWVPANASQVFLNISLTPNAAADAVSFLPYGSISTGAGIVELSGSVAAVAQLGSVAVPYGVDATTDYTVPTPVVLYKTTSASDTLVLTVCGFADLL
jgi:hypothetical protein